MRDERRVVLCQSAAGLRAAGWLAQQGVAVRLLCLGPFPQPLLDEPGVMGPPEPVEALMGPCDPVEVQRGLWWRHQTRSMPRQKRALFQLAGALQPRPVARWALKRLRRRRPASFAGWCEQRFGEASWGEVIEPYARKRFGRDPRELTARGARALLGQAEDRGWWRPREALVERTVDLVLEAGGEALDEVEVEGLELERGQVSAVLTEFGRERVEGRLFTDLTPEALGRLSGTEPRDSLSAYRADLVEVELTPASAGPTVQLLHLMDRRSPGYRVVNHGGRCVVHMTLSAGQDLHGAVEALARGLGEDWGAPLQIRQVRRQVGAVVQPALASLPLTQAWLAHADALNLALVGPVARHRHLSLTEELAQVAALAAGASNASLSPRDHEAGPPDEPWTLLPD